VEDEERDLDVFDSYRIVTSVEPGGTWTAIALHPESGDRFGIDVSAANEHEARERLERWLAWQREHSQALAALQQAERAYHRAMTDAAFASSSEQAGGLGAELQAIDSARRALDDVRARQPNV
jgi:hypothetical protein